MVFCPGTLRRGRRHLRPNHLSPAEALTGLAHEPGTGRAIKSGLRETTCDRGSSTSGLGVSYEQFRGAADHLRGVALMTFLVSAFAAGWYRELLGDAQQLPLLHYDSKGWFKLKAALVVEPQAVANPDLPWLAMFGWYVVVMMYADAASTTAVVAAAT